MIFSFLEEDPKEKKKEKQDDRKVCIYFIYIKNNFDSKPNKEGS